jgi:hypothetical protein
VRRAAAIIKAKIFISYNTAPQYVHQKESDGKRHGKRKRTDPAPAVGPPRGRIPPPPSPSASHRLIHGRVFAGSVKKNRVFLVASDTVAYKEQHRVPSWDGGWCGLAGCPPPPHERIDRDGGENEPQNPAGNSARDLLIRQDRDMFPEILTKRRAGTPIPGRRNLTGRRRRRYPQCRRTDLRTATT